MDTASTAPERTPQTVPLRSRLYGAFWGLHIGDALGIASHGYYNRTQLRRDYGRIHSYVKPQLIHPESILFRIGPERFHPLADVRGSKADLWGRRQTHYHHGLEAGDNSLSVLLFRQMCESLLACGGLNLEDFCAHAERVLLEPGAHNDLLVPDPWRVYCVGMGNGRPRRERAGPSESLAGLVWTLPIILFYAGKPGMRERLGEAVALTQASPLMRTAAMLLADIFEAVFAGGALETAVETAQNAGNPLLEKPIAQWARDKVSDDKIASYELRCASPVAHALPMSLFLAMKYAPAIESALLANANLGGATCYRGAITGALLGAAYGCEAIPAELASGLRDFAVCDGLCDRMFLQAQ